MYRFAFRPSMFGVKCVVEHEGRWLLVRNTYGRGYWTLPGEIPESRGAAVDEVLRLLEVVS